MAVAGRGAAAVKPIFSRDLGEAKRRVRELYRAWYREVPNTGEGAPPAPQEAAPGQGRAGRPGPAAGCVWGSGAGGVRERVVSPQCTCTSWTSR